MAAQNAGISIVQHRDQKQPRRDADSPHRRDRAVPLPRGSDLDHGKQQRRKKQQLHMLPCGLVDGAERPCQQLFSAPFIGKMRQRPQHRYREKARKGPEVQPFAHTVLPETPNIPSENRRPQSKDCGLILCGLSRFMRQVNTT